MPREESALTLAEHLLAATLSASNAVDEDDWTTAGSLLRRREQLLTQLERRPDLQAAELLLHRVQEAELILLSKMDEKTKEAMGDLKQLHAASFARRAYRSADQGARLFERMG